jgi:hypothetical protein
MTGYGNLTLRLWKGTYGFLALGAEIGLYTKNGRSLTKKEIAALGIKSTKVQMFNKEDNSLIGEKTENGSYWTTRFSGKFNKKGNGRENSYTINIFEFETEGQAQGFYDAIDEQIGEATDYFKNKNEQIDVTREGTTVKIYYGVEVNE